MGLPLEQWRGGEEDGKDGSSAPGCRTPGAQAGRAGGGNECPAAPRKRRAPAGPVSRQQQRRDFYNGPDVEAFFAANNL
ncbi:unnamed protein product [Urochloa decumbens]|uniref:Uncharacterized protein n=1 Tax=Urochloa decumbens TaxID=240449 RepID=A0ABC8XUD4_9POAL